MKTKIVCLVSFFIVAFSLRAQQGINYKAIINDADGNLLANTAITIQFTILENGTTTVYSEMHDTITDANGILIVNIGEGTVLSGDFNTIQWGSAPHYLKTEIDKGEGLVDMGTMEFKTVPYALHAKTAAGLIPKIKVSASGDILYLGEDQSIVIPGISKANSETSDEIIDGSGNIYNYVKIGNQYWLNENLRTTKLNDGTNIPHVSGMYDWNYLQTPAYCYYDNDEISNAAMYGALYNWYVVQTGKLCPVGWHVPTDAEWTELATFIEFNGYIGIEGTVLKSASGWLGDANGTDDYGFNGLPGGRRDVYARFSDITAKAYFWSTTTYLATSGNDQYAKLLFLDIWNYIRRAKLSKSSGLSVRCIRD